MLTKALQCVEDSLATNSAEEFYQYNHGKDESQMQAHTIEKHIWAKIVNLLEKNVKVSSQLRGRQRFLRTQKAPNVKKIKIKQVSSELSLLCIKS